MNSSKTTKAPFSLGRFLNDKRRTSYHRDGEVVPITRFYTGSPSTVSVERGSKVKKMGKARRVVREILEKSAPCVSGDAHAKTTGSDSESGMDFSSEPLYEECAVIMRPKAPSKYRQYLDRNPLQKPTTLNAQRASSHSWNIYTPPSLSTLTFDTSDHDVLSAASDESLLVGDTSHCNLPEYKSTSPSLERVYAIEISRWSLDSEDLCIRRPSNISLANQHPELSAFEKQANISTSHDSVASTIPFPSVKEFNAVDAHIPFNADAVVSEESCEDYSFYPSPYTGTDTLSDSATSSPTEGSCSPTSLYSQETDSPSMPSAAFIVEESDISTPRETHITKIALKESSEGFSPKKHWTDCFDVKMNRRRVIYSDCSLDLADFRLSTCKTDSTIFSDEYIHGQEPGNSSSIQSIQSRDGRRVNHEHREQGRLPTLLPPHINLHKIRNTTRTNSPRITASYVDHPPGSTFISSDRRVTERL